MHPDTNLRTTLQTHTQLTLSESGFEDLQRVEEHTVGPV